MTTNPTPSSAPDGPPLLPIHLDNLWSDDSYPACPSCGQAWAVFDQPTSGRPHALPVDPPTPERRTYRPTGPDTGGLYRHMEWDCNGHRMAIALPAMDLLLCIAGDGGTPCRAGTPHDNATYARPATNRCDCCDRRGNHYVRRDRTALPPCRRPQEPTPGSAPTPTSGVSR